MGAFPSPLFIQCSLYPKHPLWILEQVCTKNTFHLYALLLNRMGEGMAIPIYLPYFFICNNHNLVAK